MENLWAPWRMELLRQPAAEQCFFCEYIQQDQDEQNLILERCDKGFVIMNRYPYNNGHLLIAPYQHTNQFDKMESNVRAELMEIVAHWQTILTKAMNPHGFNIGINLGRVAGAGIDSHLHWHLIPRWNGDTSFIPIVSNAKVINQHLPETYRELKKILEND